MSEQKEKVLQRCNKLPGGTIVEYIKDGTVTMAELIERGLSAERQRIVESALAEQEQEAWDNAYQTNSVEGYRSYLNTYPNGPHSSDAKSRIGELDDSMWQSSKDCIDGCRKYLEKFPNGKHCAEAQEMIDDEPWFEAKKRNTIAGYEEYKQNHQGKHAAEIEECMNNLRDDTDWEGAVAAGNTEAFKAYLAQHPNGKHVHEATTRINNSVLHDKIISDLSNDVNAYNVFDVKKYIENGTVSLKEIGSILSKKVSLDNDTIEKAITDWQDVFKLPRLSAPETLAEDSTEVYMWGAPGSGKTCALGAILTQMKNDGILNPLQCPGKIYMDQLSSNIFNTGREICNLPSSTADENLYEMKMEIRDEKKKKHKVTMIDLAGEIFKAFYLSRNGMKDKLSNEQQKMVDKVKEYLTDRRNNKIHFFIVEYGGEDRMIKITEDLSVKMSTLLEDMAGYLKDMKIMDKATVGVYILVTKTDKIDCKREERPEKAKDYVVEKLTSFYNNLDDICNDAAIKGKKTLSFSIGDVFTQNLCKYDGRDTQKVIRKLVEKTGGEGGFWGRLKKWLIG